MGEERGNKKSESWREIKERKKRIAERYNLFPVNCNFHDGKIKIKREKIKSVSVIVATKLKDTTGAPSV